MRHTVFLNSLSEKYQAVYNDASILMDELKEDEKLRRLVSTFHENWGGDVVFVIDRGYRLVLAVQFERFSFKAQFQ